ncbi:transposase [Sphingobacterium sp. SRCM116780]|uniref:ISAon1 family transposase n=1 Tax=Sphingobacterium sp. SRCM116780 TaxID=2907623 RepID=UPI001F3D3CA4|nr:transposase [Sphingobacterium sp. SRCM116780]UIR56391.1 transposase [Sphingobacterium sp. SRCM116780]
MDNHPVSAHLVGLFFHVDGKQLQDQYKNHLSDFHDWDQKPHAEQWILFPENISEHLSIDETSFSNGELYTIISSKSAKGRKGTILATIRGTKAEDIITVLEKIPLRSRNKVKEVTMDMAPNMAKAIRRCFRNARRVVDRFHVQKLAYDAVQELRIKYRWEVLDTESKNITVSRKQGQTYEPELLVNGDTLKQLLARSRHLLFKYPSRWTESQKHRAELLFLRFPKLKQAYDLGIVLGDIFNKCKDKKIAFTKLGLWHNQVEKVGIISFESVARSIAAHHQYILHYFDNRSTNASAESFNAKLKAFRSVFRGVRDTTFFLYRGMKLYA